MQTGTYEAKILKVEERGVHTHSKNLNKPNKKTHKKPIANHENLYL